MSVSNECLSLLNKLVSGYQQETTDKNHTEIYSTLAELLERVTSNQATLTDTKVISYLSTSFVFLIRTNPGFAARCEAFFLAYQQVKPLDSLVNSQFQIKTELDSLPAVKEVSQPESPVQPYQSAFFTELQREIARRARHKIIETTAAAEKQSQTYSSNPC